MTEDRRTKLCDILQRRNDEIAAAAAERVWSDWEPALVGSSVSSSADSGGMPSDGVPRPTTPAKALDMIINGFQHLGPVIGLCIIAEEPGVVVDSIQWLRRMFTARGMSPEKHGWEAGILEAYAAACCGLLNEAECAIVKDAVARTIAALPAA